MTIRGIHHVTAIASDAATNLDFYTRALGLRFVKRTVNFDDPGTYHLYYGDDAGRPGTVLTFFPWAHAKRGAAGAGQARATAFAVPADSIGWWRERLSGLGVITDDPARRFDDEVLTVLDPDGMRLELVGVAERPDAIWADGPIPVEHAIGGFAGVTLAVGRPEGTVRVLTELMGFERLDERGDRVRLASRAAGEPGRVVDVVADSSGFGRLGAGSVHHVAFRVEDDEVQEAWRERLTTAGIGVTPVQDRTYFRSIYFREPSGVLFEIATDGPGFTLDEPLAKLGADLKLPPWLEPQRERIESRLEPLSLPAPAGVPAE